MKRVYLFLFGLLSLVPTLTNAQPLSEGVSVTTDTQTPLIASYLKDLEEQGYCVIPQVLSTSEAELLYQRIWHEFIEKAWPNCRLDDRSNWKAIKDKGAKALIPPRKNARWDPKLKERNRGISERRGLGLDEVGLGLWGKLTGYSKRTLVEASFSRLKRMHSLSLSHSLEPLEFIQSFIKEPFPVLIHNVK